MKKCIFCQIAKGRRPCFKIYEDKNYLAFLDINYFTPGHTQVITKKHYRWVWDVPQTGEFFKVAAKIARHYQKFFKNSWVASIVWGKMVEHAHIQILPAPKGTDLVWKRNKLTKAKGRMLAKKLSLEQSSSEAKEPSPISAGQNRSKHKQPCR
ncbi:MAG: HIT domain-containing protein [Candidatus Pacebacteria bacterium]|nr:HIT domain-containing protein [Candidatus Paceibacterota bacterium]